MAAVPGPAEESYRRYARRRTIENGLPPQLVLGLLLAGCARVTTPAVAVAAAAAGLGLKHLRWRRDWQSQRSSPAAR